MQARRCTHVCAKGSIVVSLDFKHHRTAAAHVRSDTLVDSDCTMGESSAPEGREFGRAPERFRGECGTAG